MIEKINFAVLTYLMYVPISIAITVWVARTLFVNGRIFLVDTFHGDESLADSVNRLLLIGFYLINIGYIVLALQIMGDVLDFRGVIEELSTKVGRIILILAGMHFFNLFVFFKLKNRGKKKKPNHPKSITQIVEQVSSLQDVIQESLDMKEMLPYYNKKGLPMQSPLVLLENKYVIPEMKLHLHGSNVRILTKEEIDNEMITAYIEFIQVIVGKKEAFASFIYHSRHIKVIVKFEEIEKDGIIQWRQLNHKIITQ